MLSLTIEVFALYSVDIFGVENKGHHQKHNLHLVRRKMIASLIILSKCEFTKVISEWDCILKIFHLQREHPQKIDPFLFLLSSCTSSCWIFRIIYYTSPESINDTKFLVWNFFYAAWFKKHLRLFQSAWLMYMKTWFFRNMICCTIHLLYKNISRRYLQT